MIEVSTSIRQEFPMTTCSISPLRQRMMEDMSVRKLSTGTQKGHLRMEDTMSALRRIASALPPAPGVAGIPGERLDRPVPMVPR